MYSGNEFFRCTKCPNTITSHRLWELFFRLAVLSTKLIYYRKVLHTWIGAWRVAMRTNSARTGYLFQAANLSLETDRKKNYRMVFLGLFKKSQTRNAPQKTSNSSQNFLAYSIRNWYAVFLLCASFSYGRHAEGLPFPLKMVCKEQGFN